MISALRENSQAAPFSNQARVQSESLPWRSLAQRFVLGIFMRKQAGPRALPVPDRMHRGF
jgi:hypothetical protein